jgi:hypothetical protein
MRKPISVITKNVVILCIISLLFFCFYNLLLKWQPWNGRHMIGFVLLNMPLIALVFNKISLIRFKLLKRGIFILIFLIGVLAANLSLLCNRTAPILPIRTKSIFSMSKEKMRFLSTTSKLLSVYKMVEDNISKTGRLGLILKGDDWDFIYFGEELRRTCIPLPKKLVQEKGIVNILNELALNGILWHKPDFPLKEERFKIYKSNEYVLITR